MSAKHARPGKARRPVLVLSEDPKRTAAGNYMAKIPELASFLEGVRGNYVIDIYHDDWCAFNSGGPCNCDPDVRLRPPVTS